MMLNTRGGLMDASRVQTVALDDFEMSYETRGDGEPLVLLHGGTGIGANWDLVFDEPPAGYRLIIPDLRGHGASTNPSGEITIQQLALDVLALLDHLGLARASAIGMSLGAKTLLHVATLRPARLETMVLVSAAPYFPAQARAIMRQVDPEHQSEAAWQKMRQWHKHGDQQILALWRMVNAFADSYTDHSFTPPHLATIRARTLIVHGDRDPLYPVSLALGMYEAIPRSYLWVVPDGGHCPIFGEAAPVFRETALQFLRAAGQGRG
jgi:pimeloyl-ACP methyl ester carboxylesterase